MINPKDHPPIAPCSPEIKEDEFGMWVSGVDPSHPGQKKITRQLIAALQRCAWSDIGLGILKKFNERPDWLNRVESDPEHISACKNSYAWKEWIENEN